MASRPTEKFRAEAVGAAIVLQLGRRIRVPDRPHASPEQSPCPEEAIQTWLKTRTNSPLERIMKGIPRRTRGMDAFPDGQN